MGAPNLIPEGMENCLNYSVVTYLKKLKQQSKVEGERMSAVIGKTSKPHESGIKVNPRYVGICTVPSITSWQWCQ